MSLLLRQLLVCLGTAHILGDFLFQSDRVAREKHKLGVLLQHALAVTLLSYLLCGAWTSWRILLGVFVAHALIDFVKARLSRQDVTAFLLDQLAHLATIIIIALFAAQEDPRLFGVTLLGERYLQSLILVAGIVLALAAGGVLIQLAVEPLLQELKVAASTTKPTVTGASRGFTHGGKIIGQLERALIFLFVLSGQPASIGFLIAAKSVFRFGELKEHRHRMEAEYIIIGTMMSFGFGFLVAYVTDSLLALPWA